MCMSVYTYRYIYIHMHIDMYIYICICMLMVSYLEGHKRKSNHVQEQMEIHRVA